jgi:hypothetical protein
VLVRGSGVDRELDADAEAGAACDDVRMVEGEDGGGCVAVVARERARAFAAAERASDLVRLPDRSPPV